MTAVQALALQGPDAEEAVDELAQLLQDRPPGLRYAAATALAAVGPAAKKAMPQLLQAMKDDKLEVQQAAFAALLRINADDAPGLQDLFRKLNEEHHWAAPYVLRQFGSTTKDAVKPLIERLKSKDDGERLAAALALAQIGDEAQDAIPALQKMLIDSNAQLQFAAALALGRLQQDQTPQTDQQVAFGAAAALVAKLNLALAQLQDLQRALWASTPKGSIVLSQDKAWRPVNRQAFFDPKVQTLHGQFVTMHVLISATLHELSQKGKGGCPTQYVKDLPPAMQLLYEPNKKAVDSFEAEAIPALMRGMQQAAYYDIGFT